MSNDLEKGATGKTAETSGISDDATNCKNLSKRLIHLRKMEVLGRLAEGMAHDFNNILTAIMGNAQLILMRTEEGSDSADMAAQIVETGKRAVNLTHQLLMFARKGIFSAVDVNIHEVIDEVTGLLSQSPGRQITVNTNLAAGAVTVLGDASQLRDSLLALAVNARDAIGQEGTITFTTSIETLDEDEKDSAELPMEIDHGRYVRITVADTGAGMTAEVMDRVFEPFFTTKETGIGVGMGLSMVYGCIRNHNGCISVRSTPGEGTVFRILLPVASQ